MKTILLSLLLALAGAGSGRPHRSDCPYDWLENEPVHVVEFICRYSSMAIEVSDSTGVPAALMLAVAALESAWDDHLASRCCNLFGIKVWENEDPQCCRLTREYVDDREFACFKRYAKPEDGFRDFARMICSKENYERLPGIPKWKYAAWAHGLAEAGYATDPAYAEKLVRIIERYQLYRFDF